MAHSGNHSKESWKKVTIGSHFHCLPIRVMSKELFQKLRVPNQFVARIKDSEGDWTYGHAKISAGKVGACFSVNESVVHSHDLPPQRKRSTRRSSSVDKSKPGEIEVLTDTVFSQNSFIYEFEKLSFLKHGHEILSDDHRNTGAVMRGRQIPFNIFGNLDFVDRQGTIAHKNQSEHVQDFENFEGSLVLYRRPVLAPLPAADSAPDCPHVGKSRRSQPMPPDGLVEVRAGVDPIPGCATCVPLHKLYGNILAAPAVWYTEKDECIPGFAFTGHDDGKVTATFCHGGHQLTPSRGDLFQIHCCHSWDPIEFEWCQLGNIGDHKLFHIDGQEHGLVPCVVSKRFQGLGSYCPTSNQIKALVDEKEGTFHEHATLEHSSVLCYKTKKDHH